MPKNKNGQNAFYYFMVDWKKQEESKGQTFPRGLKDVQANAKCNEAWKNLPEQTKILYTEKEKNNKIQMKVSKKTSLGESIEEVEKSELSNAEFMDEMKRSISTIITQAARNRCIEKLKFHVIHINYLYSCICDNNQIVYYPAEVGIAEFSLEKGITRTYHKIVNSKVKMGYASAAIDHSKSTHQIPRNFGESDYALIYEDIFKFLESSRYNGKLPPLYTLYKKEDVKHSVMCGLELFANSHDKFRENFIIYSFEELFINLRNINIDDEDDTTKFDNVIVSIKLAEDPYDYRKNLACGFHQTCGGENYCSKSIIQRWIFILYLFTCSLFNIDLESGIHTPVENTNEDVQLNSSLEKMNLTKNLPDNKKQSKHPSERTWADEKKRRSEAITRPIQIVHNSEINSRSPNASATLQEPLAPPFTKPITSYTEDCSGITNNEFNFPSIGRGSQIRSQRGNARRNKQSPQNRE